MKKIIAINGGPRKTFNTAALLKGALEGARSAGAETEIVNLYDLDYKGCISCLACKLRGGPSYGKCAVKDGLTPVLEKVAAADGVVFASPIYFMNFTGMMRCFLERLIFQYLVYDKNYSSLFQKKIPTAFICTMNINDDVVKGWNLDAQIGFFLSRISATFGSCEAFYCTDTCQVKDYSKYEITSFDVAHKLSRKETQFPLDLRKAFEIGKGLVG